MFVHGYVCPAVVSVMVAPPYSYISPYAIEPDTKPVAPVAPGGPVAPVAPVPVRLLCMKVEMKVPMFFQALCATMVAPLRVNLAPKAQDALYCRIAVRVHPADLLLSRHDRLGPATLQTEPSVRVALLSHLVCEKRRASELGLCRAGIPHVRTCGDSASIDLTKQHIWLCTFEVSYGE